MDLLTSYLSDWFRATSLWGNTMEAYLIAAVAILLVLFVFRMFHYMTLWHLEDLSAKTENDFDDLLIDMLQSVTWWFYIYLSVWIGLFYITLAPLVRTVADSLLIILLVYQVIRAAGYAVEYGVRKQFNQPAGHEDSIVALLSKLIRGILWALGFLFVLQNLGVDVTSLIAGLGIGGIAIALALQNILSDLFSSFSIYFDRPFQVGDFIAVGEFMGTVEEIGIKTTRLRSLHGEEIVLANRDLTTARIQNYRGMGEWRGSFTVGVSYDTSPELLDRAKELIQETVESADGARFERANITAFGESSINIDAVFYSETGDYNEHLATQHAIHRHVKERLEHEGVTIAFPTRTIYMHNAA